MYTLNITYPEGINIFETYPRKNAVAAWKGFLYARQCNAHVVVKTR
jgi:hypothetical protein